MSIPQTDEYLLRAISTHWIKYVLPVVLYVVFTGVSLGLFVFAGAAAGWSGFLSHTGHFLGLGMLLLAHHWFFHRILSESLVDIIITTKRVIYLENSLFVSNLKHDVALERLRAVEAREKGLIQNILRYGDLWFDTGGSDVSGGTVIHLVPHPQSLEKEIMELMEMK